MCLQGKASIPDRFGLTRLVLSFHRMSSRQASGCLFFFYLFATNADASLRLGVRGYLSFLTQSGNEDRENLPFCKSAQLKISICWLQIIYHLSLWSQMLSCLANTFAINHVSSGKIVDSWSDLSYEVNLSFHRMSSVRMPFLFSFICNQRRC